MVNKYLTAHGYDLIVKRNEALVAWKAIRRLIGRCPHSTRLNSFACYYVTLNTGVLPKITLFFPLSVTDLCETCRKSFQAWMKYVHYEEALREIIELGSK